MAYFAYILEDNRQQTVLQHLEGAAELCSRFVMPFGAEEQGMLIGLAHVISGNTPMLFSVDFKGIVG